MESLRRLVEQMYDAIDGNDADALVELMCPDVIYERPQTAPLHGRDAIKAFYLHERRIPSGQHTLEHVAIDHDCGAAWGAFAGVRTDGAPVTLRFADVFTFEGGRIRTRRSHIF